MYYKQSTSALLNEQQYKSAIVLIKFIFRLRIINENQTVDLVSDYIRVFPFV